MYINLPSQQILKEPLLLLHYPFSFNSQKVAMTLIEKKLPFNRVEVDLFNQEQYDLNYLTLNPKGEVPVLMDEGKIILDSKNIINYLEDNYKNGIPSLIPTDKRKRSDVLQMRNFIYHMPIDLLTMGALLNPKYMKNPKAPYFGCFRKTLARNENNLPEKLRDLARKYPEMKDELEAKADYREAKYNKLKDERNFMQLVSEIDEGLVKIERELRTRPETEWWLCCAEFTLADIELAVVFENLNQLGLTHLFLGKDKPFLKAYYEKVKKRESFKKAVPGRFYFYKTFLGNHSKAVFGFISGFTFFVFVGFFVAQKLKAPNCL